MKLCDLSLPAGEGEGEGMSDKGTEMRTAIDRLRETAPGEFMLSALGMGGPDQLLAKAILEIDARLREVERWQEVEDTRAREASEYGPD